MSKTAKAHFTQTGGTAKEFWRWDESIQCRSCLWFYVCREYAVVGGSLCSEGRCCCSAQSLSVYLLPCTKRLKSSLVISALRGKNNWQIVKQGKEKTMHTLCAWSPETDWDTGAVLSVSADSRHAQSWKLGLVVALSSCATWWAFSLSLPPPLQRQHKAMKDWRQSDVLRFILPESLRMLSVPHEGSDESRLSVCHLIISQKKSLWCYPLTMAHSSLLTTVPTNNEELTAATNGDEVVPTVHLRVRRIK